MPDDKDIVKLAQDANLLGRLNGIVDFAVGNQAPDDVAIGERSTLPELLAYI